MSEDTACNENDSPYCTLTHTDLLAVKRQDAQIYILHVCMDILHVLYN